MRLNKIFYYHLLLWIKEKIVVVLIYVEMKYHPANSANQHNISKKSALIYSISIALEIFVMHAMRYL